jgi:hypothetical protein
MLILCYIIEKYCFGYKNDLMKFDLFLSKTNYFNMPSNLSNQSVKEVLVDLKQDITRYLIEKLVYGFFYLNIILVRD